MIQNIHWSQYAQVILTALSLERLFQAYNRMAPRTSELKSLRSLQYNIVDKITDQ